MESMWGHLAGGLALMFDPVVLLFIAAGTVAGFIVGAVPGLGVQLAFAIAIPFTFVIDAVPAIALLMAISVSVMYGNSLPAVLVGIPGSPAAILSVLDGYELQRRGDGAVALGTALMAALVGQATSVVFFTAMVIPLAGIAYHFLTPEMFALYMLGIVAIISLAGKNLIKGAIAALFGLLLAMVGLDPVSATPRFTFDIAQLRGGISVPAAVIGLLAGSELLRQSRQAFEWDAVQARMPKFPGFKRLLPGLPGTMIGAVVGTLVGAIPGAGSTPASLISYQMTQALSKNPQEFGKGSVAGLAANESAQNSANSGELIPTLGLGIPGSGSMVLLLAALSINGFIAGPQLIREAPHLLDATIAGLLGSTALLLVLGWPMAKVLARALTVNRSFIIVFGLMITAIGVFSLRYRVLDVFISSLLAVVGAFMVRYGYPVAATALAVVLGASAESAFRRGMNIFDNSITSFAGRPITAGILLLAFGFLVLGIRRNLRDRRAPTDGGEAALEDAEQREELAKASHRQQQP